MSWERRNHKAEGAGGDGEPIRCTAGLPEPELDAPDSERDPRARELHVFGDVRGLHEPIHLDHWPVTRYVPSRAARQEGPDLYAPALPSFTRLIGPSKTRK